MRLTAKIRSLQPGEFSVQRYFEATPEFMEALLALLQNQYSFPENAWLVTAELVVAVECVVPKMESGE